MTPETAKHFKPAKYERYPHAGSFVVTEPYGEKRTVTLWHNKPVGDTSEEQPRFFEEDSRKLLQGNTRLLPSAVPDHNKMTRDNYNNILHELAVPITPEPGAYRTTHELYVQHPKHKVTVEQVTSPDTQKHTRIRRIATGDLGPPFFLTYESVVTKLERDGVIYAEDFTHWVPQPPLGAKHELRTRINAPRK